MLELARSIDLREVTPLRVNEAADKEATELDRQPKLILDRSGIIPDPLISSVFASMQERSLEGRYQTPDGRQRIFYHMPFDGQTLIDMPTPENADARIAQLTSFTSQIPAFVDRAETRIVQKWRFGPKQVWEHSNSYHELADPSDPAAVMRNFIESYIEDVKGETNNFWWSDILDAIVLFGNPDEELFGKYGSRIDIPRDGKYPILTPIFDITLAPDKMPEDPLQALDDYNRKIDPYMDKIYHKKIKKSDVMTPEEIRFADQCRFIVSLMHNMTYQSLGSSSNRGYVEGIIAAPLFPLRQLRRHDSYDIWEHWGTGIDNADLNETFARFPATPI